MRQCPKCGSTVDDNVQFCAYCGTNLSTVALQNEASTRCRNCGVTIPIHSGIPVAFCPSCGQSLNGNPPSRVNQPAYPQQQVIVREVVKEKKKKSGCLLYIILGILVIFILAPAYNRYMEKKNLEDSTSRQSSNRSDYKTDLSYDELARNPQKHKGKLVSFTGSVLQTIEGSSKVQIRLATKKNDLLDAYYEDIIFCEFSSSIVNGRLLEGDIITVYGECNGTKTYTSVLGNDVTLPFLLVSIIDVAKK